MKFARVSLRFEFSHSGLRDDADGVVVGDYGSLLCVFEPFHAEGWVALGPGHFFASREAGEAAFSLADAVRWQTMDAPFEPHVQAVCAAVCVHNGGQEAVERDCRNVLEL